MIRQIHEAKPRFIRRVFAMVAHGKGLAKIAKTLNAEHIARWSPKASAAAPPLLDALGREEARKQVVMAEIATLKAQRPLDLEPAAVETVKHTLQERAGDVRTLLGRQPVQARQAIRKLLVGKLSFVPLECDGVPVGYRFTGQATLGRLLTGGDGRCQPRWWPQRDSNPCFSHDHVFANSLG